MRFSCLALYAVLCHSAYANSFVYVNSETVQPLQNGLLILEDINSSFKPFQVTNNSPPTVNTKGIPRFELGSTFWIKFHIKNLSHSKHLLLMLSQPNIEVVDFYRIEKDTIIVQKNGTIYPYKNRPYDNQHFLFDILLNKGQTGSYLLRLKSTARMDVPLWDRFILYSIERLTQRRCVHSIICRSSSCNVYI